MIFVSFSIIFKKSSDIFSQENSSLIYSCPSLPMLLISCLLSNKNEIFLISDDFDLSTVGIINHLSQALNISPKLLPVPEIFLKFCFRILRKRNYESRLLGNLRVDVSKNKQLLDWKPNYSVEEAFQKSFSLD